MKRLRKTSEVLLPTAKHYGEKPNQDDGVTPEEDKHDASRIDTFFQAIDMRYHERLNALTAQASKAEITDREGQPFLPTRSVSFSTTDKTPLLPSRPIAKKRYSPRFNYGGGNRTSNVKNPVFVS